MEFHVATLLGDEVPSHLVEFFPAVVESAVALGFEVLFENYPGFEAGVIGARDEPGGVAFEPVVSDKGVFDGDGEAVADVEIAVGVGGREDDRVGVCAFVLGWRESAGRFPESVDVGLELIGFVGFAEFHSISVT